MWIFHVSSRLHVGKIHINPAVYQYNHMDEPLSFLLSQSCKQTPSSCITYSWSYCMLSKQRLFSACIGTLALKSQVCLLWSEIFYWQFFKGRLGVALASKPKQTGVTLFSPLALEIGLCVICLHPMRPSPSWSLQTKQTESLKQGFSYILI